MQTKSYQPPSGKDWRVGILIIAGYVSVISVTAFLLLPNLWYLWLLIVIIGMVWIVNWHTRSYAYQCTHCSHEFEISFLINLISPHGVDSQGGWTWLKCPDCNKRSRARIIKIVRDHPPS